MPEITALDIELALLSAAAACGIVAIVGFVQATIATIREVFGWY